MRHHFAGRIALVAFGMVMVQGALGSLDVEGCLKSALAAGCLFYGFGFMVGELGRRMAEERARADFTRWMVAATAPKNDSAQ